MTNEATGRSDSFDAQAHEALQAIAAIHQQAEEQIAQVRMNHRDSDEEDEQPGTASDTPARPGDSAGS